VPFQRPEQPGGVSLPRRPAPPRTGVWAGSEPQPPAGRHRSQPTDLQPHPGRKQAAKQSASDTSHHDDGHPPGQGVGPVGPLGRPHPPPPRLGRPARLTPHAGWHLYRHHRPILAGAGQQPVRVIGEVGEDGLEVGLAERPHRAAGPILVVVEGPGSATGHRGPPSCWG
jgi:hypothetical protein